MNQTRAKQGETLDAICLRIYGNTQMTNALVELNTHLDFTDPVLPHGTTVYLAEQVAQQTESINLWD